jgi:hypothetical protein
MSKATRRRYTAEFKAEAVALVQDQVYKITDAARALGIDRKLLDRWMAGCISQRCWISTTVRWWIGRWLGTCAPNSSWRRWTWPSGGAGRRPGSFTTAIVAASLGSRGRRNIGLLCQR